MISKTATGYSLLICIFTTRIITYLIQFAYLDIFASVSLLFKIPEFIFNLLKDKRIPDNNPFEKDVDYCKIFLLCSAILFTVNSMVAGASFARRKSQSSEKWFTAAIVFAAADFAVCVISILAQYISIIQAMQAGLLIAFTLHHHK